jgi:predicted short-subunit dehydrogenase-like oxidoreductase (DUF2520 family)
MGITSVSIIGSGNVATHLAKILRNTGFVIRNIYSRNFNNATQLANEVEAAPVSNIKDLLPVDIVIICVSDSAIEQVCNQITLNQALIVHTSGSTSIDILRNHKNYGVFYPFQTFSKNTQIDFSKVPVFIEANTSDNEEKLTSVASKISSSVKKLTTENRLKLHLAAVFANNFANHMFSIAHDIITEANLPFEILNHLIHETTSKAISSGNPSEVQTGPAVRNNTNIMELHKEILANKPLYQKIYTFVSSSIIESVTDKKNGTL